MHFSTGSVISAMSMAYTLAPRSSSISQVALPMPDAAPVTTQILP